MAIHLLDKGYAVAGVAAVPAGRVVVQGPNPGECVLPSVANASNILGVTVHAQPTPGRTVGVRKAGIAEVVAAGAITVGAPVNIADNAGRVKAIDEADETKIACLGFAETSAAAAGDIIEVFIALHERIV